MIHHTNDGDLYYDITGPSEGPLLIFTHGAGMHSGMFERQVEFFSTHYRCLVWDLPGHGQSYRMREDFKFIEAAETIIQLMDAVGGEKAVLIGQSMGSMLSQYAAHCHPHRVEGIVSVGGTRLKATEMSAFQKFAFRISPYFFKLTTEKKFFYRLAKSKAVTEEAQKFYEESLLHMGRKQFGFLWRGLMQSFELGIDTPVKHPLMICHGDHDSPPSLLEEAHEWHNLSPDSRLVIIPKAGHNANMDAPEAFNEELAVFLNRLRHHLGQRES